jgi:hypothetical protein
MPGVIALDAACASRTDRTAERLAIRPYPRESRNAVLEWIQRAARLIRPEDSTTSALPAALIGRYSPAVFHSQRHIAL